jgi:hypothetical protein
MKLATIAAAAVIALTGVAPGMVAPAAAQRTVVHERTVVRGPGPHRLHSRRVCRTTYRHHHRVRTCRTVR